MDARRELFVRITEIAKADFDAYYRKHPARILDSRHIDAVVASMVGLEKIKALLLEYRIERIEPPPTVVVIVEEKPGE